ncbi:MAG: cytochrome c3 family protein [Desulfobacula sp.]|jgi:hypothetical protein|nr:cytochrome c3 family protein [Desulfobacula sp.]
MFKNITFILGSCSFIILCYTSIAFSGIVGSVHDFTDSGVGIPVDNGTNEICIVCHTPHNAMDSTTAKPLWNHELTTSVFTLYHSNTFEGDSTIHQPSGVSKLCLSCHDGTVALNNWGSKVDGVLFMNGHKIILSTNLSNDHPISFDYTSALASSDGKLHDPVTTNSGLGDIISNDLLVDNRVECTSCHDIHNKMGNGNYQAPRYGLLWKKNDNSALCLTCHNK